MAFLEIHTHFQKQPELKMNPGDFAGMEGWELWPSLAGRMQAGINMDVGVGSESSPRSVSWGLRQIKGAGMRIRR